MNMKIKYLIPAVAAVLALVGCSQEQSYSIATGEVVNSITTDGASFTATTADLTGTVQDLSELASGAYSVGFCYGTSSDPTTTGKKVTGTFDATTGTVTASISGLTAYETYYYATYVLLSGKVYFYGNVMSFVTTDAAIATLPASEITIGSALVGAQVNVASDGISAGQSTYTIGFVLSNEQGQSHTYTLESEESTFYVEIAGLIPGQTYTYQAFLDVDGTLTYGEEQTFTTEVEEMEYVDLGLSVLWAKKNIGAADETDFGAHIGWGDVGGLNFSAYNTAYSPAEDIVGTSNDVAYYLSDLIDGDAIMSSTLPTAEQFQELIDGTEQEWTTIEGIAGIKFTASNGNYIFLPAGGYFDTATDEVFSGDGTSGNYWTGNIDPTDSEHGRTLYFTESGAGLGTAELHVAACVRSVRKPDAITPDSSKILFVNADGDGSTGRIEIYNEYGSTKNDPGLDINTIAFSKNMVVTFSISGINDNLKSSARGSYIAGLEFADASWDPSYWSPKSGTKYDAVVTGDGTYTVWMECSAKTEGAVVFCIDMPNLWSDLTSTDAVSVAIESIKLDANVDQEINNDIVNFQNKDGNGTDGRIDIYNEYAASGAAAPQYYNDKLNFNGAIIVNFHIEGIDGNLVDGASASYNTELSYADADWRPSYWGGAGYGNTTVTGDGDYEVYALMSNDCSGAVVWTVEIYGLWKDLVDTDAVSVSINYVQTPGKK